MSYALVTGAAKGIGRSIAFELAKRHYHLLLVDFAERELQQTARELQNRNAIHVHTLTQDLSEPDSAAKIFSWTELFHNRLTVVVNNAGYGLNGAFEELSLQEQFGIIDVNIKAQLALTHVFLPVLKRFHQSYLLNVCSTTAYQPVPYLNVYAASKAFILSFNRSLQHELRHTPVSLCILSPGATDTDFVKRARMGAHTQRIADRFNMTADEVAKIAVKGLFAGKEEIVPGFSNKLNSFLPKFFPVSFVRRIAASIYEKKKPAAVVQEAGRPIPT
ncbi:SDR family oxidoreductase [Paraflavisolibacter sp. H34]|uniref:SDR family NAD(P)-dependent oxidoreductase n=1 Tax=Huijunlia imazamoxiresistens TaxID=3127457 RepID=UPI00301AA9A2